MIPKIDVENIKLSKMVCGTNQFVGISHRGAFSMFYYKMKFKKLKRVTDIMIHLLQEHGVNCTISSPRENVYKAIQEVEKESGDKYYWLCTPSKRRTVPGIEPNISKQIEWCADHNVSACLLHRSYTDYSLDKKELVIKGLTELTAKIRDLGMIPGLSAHYVEVIYAVDKNNYDIKLITQPLNPIGFESDTDPQTLIKAIQNTKVQIVNIKPMAAGRVPPEKGIGFCVKNVKENDLIAVGFGDYKYAAEDAKIFESFSMKDLHHQSSNGSLK